MAPLGVVRPSACELEEKLWLKAPGLGSKEVVIHQSYDLDDEAQIDRYEATAELEGEQRKILIS